MVLKDLVDISIGSVLARIPKGKSDVVSVEPITIQDVNHHYLIGEKLEQRFSVDIPKEQLEKAVIAREGDLVVTLSNPKALVIGKEFDGYLVPSNMIRMMIKDSTRLDPHYLAWFISFSEDFAKIIYLNLQGTTIVKTVPVEVFREADIPIIPIDKQRKIGKISELYWKRESLQDEIRKKWKDTLMALLNSELKK